MKYESKYENKNEKVESAGLPEKKFRAGSISATIWKNAGTSKDGKPVEYRTISLQRSYTDKTGAWQSTSSLRLNDLPRASLVLNKAYEYLALKNENSVESDYSYSSDSVPVEAI